MPTNERLVPGWLAQSSAPPQRKQEIAGVSAKTAIALKAVTEQAKEQAKELRDGGLDERGLRRGRGADVASMLGPSNRGVSERAERDKLHVKNTTGDRQAEVQEALSKKARTYEMLQSGTLRDDDGQYEVDFLRKAPDRDADHPAAFGAGPSSSGRRHGDDAAVDTTGMAVGGSGGLMSEDMRRERERREWEAQEDKRREAEHRRWEHKQDILDIHEDALEQRERAEAARRDKDERREKLKEKILHDKVKEIMRQKQAAAAAAPKQKKRKAAGGGAGDAATDSKKD